MARPTELKVDLAVAAEDTGANTITVTGRVKFRGGQPVRAVKQIQVRTLAQTAGQGDIAIAGGVGTEKEAVNPATGENVAWIETTATGLFAITVTDTQAEDVMLMVLLEDGRSVIRKLTFV